MHAGAHINTFRHSHKGEGFLKAKPDNVQKQLSDPVHLGSKVHFRTFL